MTTEVEAFCIEHRACKQGREWATTHHTTMAELWADPELRPNWRIWVATRKGVLTDKELRLFACYCVRQVWHLLKDERSRNAVEVAERFAHGEATQEELAKAHRAACVVARAVSAHATYDAACAAAAHAACAPYAAYTAYDAAAHAAHAAHADADARANARGDQVQYLLNNTQPSFKE